MKQGLLCALIFILVLAGCAPTTSPQTDATLPSPSVAPCVEAEPVPPFSYAEYTALYQEGDPGVKCTGFQNTAVQAIKTAQDVIEGAKAECTIKYDEGVTKVYYDADTEMWLVLFWSGYPGDGQSVYLDSKGITHRIVYEE